MISILIYDVIGTIMKVLWDVIITKAVDLEVLYYWFKLEKMDKHGALVADSETLCAVVCYCC